MNQFPASAHDMVGLLPLHDCQLKLTASVSSIVERFKQELTLPGVIVTDGLTVIGVVARHRLADYARFWAGNRQLTRPDGYLMVLPPLELPDTCPILAAVQQVGQRSSESAGDPLVIKFRDGSRRLLDIRVLMAAQMQILTQLEQTVQSQQVQVQNTAIVLQQTQQRVSELEQALQVETAARRDLLQQHGTALQQQMTLAATAQQHLSQVQAVLAQQGQQSFQSMLTAVQMISHRTVGLKGISIALGRDVEIIHTAAGVVQQLSRQARFLGLRATVLASRFGQEAEGFGQVTADFGQLSQQVLKTGHQLAETVEHLRDHNVELMDLAQAGAKVTKALTSHVSDAKTALVDLDHLLATPNDLARTTAPNRLLKPSGALKVRSQLTKTSIKEQTSSELTDSINEHPTLIDFTPDYYD